MIVSQTIWIDGLPPAEIRREHAWPDGQGGWRSAWSLALVCPQCLRLWAVLHFPADTEYSIHPAWCAEHQPASPDWLAGVPGSILIEVGFGQIDEPLLDALPAELVRREAALHFNYQSQREQACLGYT